MTIAEALKKYSRIEADLLLGHVLKQPKEFLYMNGSKKLSPKQVLSFENMAQKRKKGMPVAYLIGSKYFYGLKFKVNRNVLIPRPETEWLVDEALKTIVSNLKTSPRAELRVLDVGTGSGIIAISIAHEIAINNLSSNIKIFATDISEAALKVAQANAKANKVIVQFSKHELLKGIKGKFNIIIANLPYVPISDYESNYENLKYEPKLAITDNSNESKLINKFISQYSKYLTLKGKLLLEVDPSTIKNIKLKNIRVIKDIKGLDRYVSLGLT